MLTPEHAVGARVGGSPGVRKRDSSCCAAAVATSLGANECPTGPATASARSAQRRSSFLTLALAFHARLYAKLYDRAQTTFSSLGIPDWTGGRPAAMMSTGRSYRPGALDKDDYSAAAPTENKGTGAHPKSSTSFSALHPFTDQTSTSFFRHQFWAPSDLLKRSGDRGWGTTVKWLSGLNLCVLVRTCFVGCPKVRPLLPTESTSQIVPTGPSAPLSRAHTEAHAHAPNRITHQIKSH